MRSLKPIEDNPVEVLKGLIESKEKPHRPLLDGILTHLELKYKEYDDNKLELATLGRGPSALSKDEQTACRHCYISPESWRDTIRWAIEKRQSGDLARCQYCGINTPNSLDHYVPKEIFPEYSVNVLNLIPCCTECNSNKGKLWLDGTGRRRFVNMYFEALPVKRYLFAKVTFDKEFKEHVEFYVSDSGGVTGQLFELVKSHFELLKLKGRMPKVANEVISESLYTLVSFGVTDPEVAQVRMQQQTQRYAKTFGPNHWRTAVSESLAESHDFLLYAAIKAEEAAA